jgi:GAF domain-containing protein
MTNQYAGQTTPNLEIAQYGNNPVSNPQTITNILRAAISGISPETSIQKAIEELQKVLGGDRVAILLKQPDRDILKVFVAAGYPQGVKDVEIPINKDNIGLVISQQKSLRINHGVQKKGNLKSKSASVLIIPLSHKETNYGVFIAERNREDEYTNSDEEIMNLIGTVFGIILANSELNNILEQEKGMAVILSSVSTKLRSLSEKQEIINTASQEIGKFLNANKLKINISIDDPQMNIDSLESTYENKELIFETGQHFHSVPIILNQHNIGSINSERGKVWTDEEKNFIEAIAYQVSSAIENVLLMEDKKKLYQRGELITDITNKVWSSQSIELILQTAIKEIGNALGADEAIIRLDSSLNNRS